MRLGSQSVILFGFWISVLLPGSIVFAHEPVTAINAEITNSVVSVLPQNISQRQLQEEPEGSGVIIGNGRIIVTADHVLGRSREVLVRTSKGEVIRAEVVARDKETDVAILSIANPMKPLPLGLKVSLAEPVCAVGNSFGLNVSVTCGVVSAVGKLGVGFNPIEDFIQTDAAVNPGMSGGALINHKGELVGMLSAIFTKTSDANIGVNFAVSSRLVRIVVDDLLDNGRTDRKSSGIVLVQSHETGSEGSLGALVMNVVPNSPEAEAGLKSGDIILAIDGNRTIHPAAYRSALAQLETAGSMNLRLARGDKVIELTVEFSN